MKKVIGYIIRLTAILLSVIFFTINGVDAAIAANNIEVGTVQVPSPKTELSLKPVPRVESNPPCRKPCSLPPKPCNPGNSEIREAYKQCKDACKNRSSKSACCRYRRLCRRNGRFQANQDVGSECETNLKTKEP